VLTNFGENTGDVAFAVQSYICPPVVLEGVRQPLVERDPAVLVLVNLLEELGTDRLSSPSQPSNLFRHIKKSANLLTAPVVDRQDGRRERKEYEGETGAVNR
jgi:hypothetical protein